MSDPETSDPLTMVATPPGPSMVGVTLTPTILEKVHPVPLSLATLHAGILQLAIELCDAVSPLRAAAFLARHLFECGWLREFTEEPSSYSGESFERYDGRTDLGNTETGDGFRFRGRGYVQLTGRKNYRSAGEALNLPLESNPELAADPRIAARIAAWYWTAHGCNALADRGDIRGVVREINGGLVGIEFTEPAYRNACGALGAPIIDAALAGPPAH